MNEIRMREMIEAADAEMAITLEQLSRAQAAASEDSFSGWLRREIHQAPMQLPAIWEQSGISKPDFLDFLEGISPLTTAQVDRLCKTLKITPVTRS